MAAPMRCKRMMLPPLDVDLRVSAGLVDVGDAEAGGLDDGERVPERSTHSPFPLLC